MEFVSCLRVKAPSVLRAVMVELMCSRNGRFVTQGEEAFENTDGLVVQNSIAENKCDLAALDRLFRVVHLLTAI